MPQNPPSNPADNSNDPKKISIVGKIPIEYDPVALKDISKAINEQTTAQQQADNASGGVSERGIKEQKKANTIAKLAALVTGLGLAATIVVIILNYKAIDAANRSTNVAESTLAESRNEFELTNRPFIQMTDLRLDSMNGGQKPVIKYNLTNTGHFPASVSEIRCGMGTGGGQPTAEAMMKAYEGYMTVRNDIGIIPFTPITYTQTMTSNIVYPKERIDSFRKGLIYVGLILEIKYSNLLAKTPYHMVQVLKIENNQAGLNLSSLKYTDEPDSSR